MARTLREAGYINKSLAFLEQVVVALGDDKPRLHIPYRSSKLTHALKDAFGVTCRTTLIACVWPSAAQADQTRATLRFAARMGRITCAPVVGRRRSASEDAASKVVARKLWNEVAVLRAELAARDLIRGTPPPAYAYGPLTIMTRSRNVLSWQSLCRRRHGASSNNGGAGARRVCGSS